MFYHCKEKSRPVEHHTIIPVYLRKPVIFFYFYHFHYFHVSNVITAQNYMKCGHLNFIETLLFFIRFFLFRASVIVLVTLITKKGRAKICFSS